MPAVYMSYQGKPTAQAMGTLMTVRDGIQAWPLLAEEEAASPSGKPSSISPSHWEKGSPSHPLDLQGCHLLENNACLCILAYSRCSINVCPMNENMTAYQAQVRHCRQRLDGGEPCLL